MAITNTLQNTAANAAASHKDSRKKTRLATIVIICTLMLCAAAISFFMLSRQSLRLDEAQSLWQSSHTPSRVLDIIGKDVHVPLYPLLLHFWEFFFGNNIQKARFLSLSFFLATIPAVYFLAKQSFNRSIGLFTAVLVSVSPFLNWYGNEIRMYSLLTLVTVINQFFFVRIFKNSESSETSATSWTGYAVTAFLGIYTHYFFWLSLASQTVFFLLYYKKFPKYSFRNFLLVFGLLILAILPWILYVKHLGFASNTQPYLLSPSSVDLFDTYSQFLFGFQDSHINTLIVSLWPLSVLFAFLALNRYKKIPPESIYYFLASILPITFAFFVSILVRPLFLSRYLILAAPSLYIFLTWFFSIYPKRIQFTVRTLLVIIMAFTLINQTTNADTPVREDYRDASNYISTRASPEDIVVLSAPFTVYPFEYYYTGQATVATLPIWDRFIAMPPFDESTLPAQVSRLSDGHQKIWLLLSYNQNYETKIHNYFETHFQQVDHQEFSPGMHLFVYRVGYNQLQLGTPGIKK